MAEQKEYIDSVVSVNRVTKVTKGGKRFSFSAFVVSGDQQGNVGIGLGKSKEVSSAIAKATMRARKNMITYLCVIRPFLIMYLENMALQKCK